MFTSRLPKSTSVRRPSGPNDGSTSFVNSNIPVSVRKANLFTPQPERSLQSSLASTARKSYLTTEKKYQRISKPVPDNDEQMRMFKSLIDFIKVNAPNFPLPESKRFFSSVSSTEASRIFEFLISRIIPEFKINKLEIDVPEVLAKLKYPYIKSVTKSALVSITTRQAIVNLLVIYNWLVAFIKAADIGEDLNSKDIEDADRSPIKIFQSLMIDPETDYGEEWLYEAFKELHPGNSFESNLNELEEINAEIEQLEENLENIQQSESTYLSYKEDLEKCVKYNIEMTNYLKGKQGEVERLRQESLELDARLEEKKRTLEDLNLKAISLDDEQELAKSIAISENEINSIERQIGNYKSLDVNNQFLEQMREEEHQLAELRERHVKVKTALLDDRDNKREKLRSEEDKDARTAKLNLEYIRSLLESNQQRAKSIVRKEEIETEWWMKVGQVLKDNNKVAKTALKMLRG